MGSNWYHISKIKKSASKKKIKLVAIQGSARSQNSCADQESKTSKILNYVIEQLPDNVEVDLIDLSVKNGESVVMPCKACISTSGGFHCHYPCDCYGKENDKMDLMSQENVYKRMEEADGFFVFTPINWGQPSSSVKSFFDRLVCINLTLTHEDAVELTDGEFKNAEKTRKLQKSDEHLDKLKNHWEGKFAAFFVQGDDGAADYKEYAKYKTISLPVFPDSYKDWESRQPKNGKYDPKDAVKDIVYQCVYSGIHVPEDCVLGVIINKGINYASANDNIGKDLETKQAAEKVVLNLIKHIEVSKNE